MMNQIMKTLMKNLKEFNTRTRNYRGHQKNVIK